MEKKKLLYLPHELIVEILLRLPVKSLICFKCVCKSWFSLISNPHFANSQFQLTAATHTHRIMCMSVSASEFCSIDFETSLNYDPHPFSLAINFSLRRSCFLQIYGSCRGFIFLMNYPDMFLWNPSTGFKTQIPLAPKHKHMYNRKYGFGYDQSRDDYLIVVLSTHCENEEITFSSHLEIFSVRDNRWKEIQGTHFPYSSDNENGLFFTGSIHWLSVHIDTVIDVIVAFDLMDRKLFEMPLPDYFHRTTSCLGVFGDFFSLWIWDYRNGTIEIWVMKEYKLNSSWTKTLVIPLNSYFNPICSTNNGDIIGKGASSELDGLTKYNNKGQLLEFHSFWDGLYDTVLYTETLLSLPSNNEQDYKPEE